MWHVSRQTPMRDLSSIRDMMAARSLNEDPIEVPLPAMVSSTVVTLLVAAWLALSCAARRAMAGARSEDSAPPGLKTEKRKRMEIRF